MNQGDTKSTLTCVSCQVLFSASEQQRQHYRSDWHTYNLKRKVAGLRPITARDFQTKVLEIRQQQQSKVRDASLVYTCQACSKHFSSANAYENHVKSKKHRELTKNDTSTLGDADNVVPKHRTTANTNTTNADASMQGDDVLTLSDAAMPGNDVTIDAAMPSNDVMDEQEEEDGENWEDMDDEEGAIPLGTCLFCSHQSTSGDLLQASLKHMYLEHGFFIPDLEYCLNPEGLMVYLGLKVGAGNMCIWCNERGKQYGSLDAVQKHMRDKCHCKIIHEGDAMLEYSDFYDYSTSYPTDSLNESDAQDDSNSLVVDDGWDLMLPSGATVGHRSLLRYYRQRLRPEKQVALTGVQKGRDSVKAVMSQYRSLGWTGVADQKQAQMKARDMKFLKKVKSRHFLKLGQKANKLQRYFKRDDIML